MIGSVVDAAQALREGELSCVDLTEQALANASAHDHLGALAFLDENGSLRQARKADEELLTGRDRGLLHGIPLTIKDVVDVAGMPTRLGTPRAGHSEPQADAEIVAQLREGGAVLIGKAATHELAFGMTSPGVANPHDPQRIAGGSSGGSAVATAVGIGFGSVGTDTGGSVRCPAALCGVVGLKPTFGRASRRGVASLAKGQDTLGFFARDSDSCAALLGAAVPASAATLPRRWPLTIAVLDGSLRHTHECVRREFEFTLERLATEESGPLGAVVVEGSELAPAVSLLVMLFEAAAEWRSLVEADPWGFGPVVLAALQVGQSVDFKTYREARALAQDLKQTAIHALDAAGVDLLVTPTLPNTAPKRGAALVDVGDRQDPVDAAHSRLLSLASVTGLPAISVPCGTDDDGLPVGVQAIGRPGSESELLSFAGQVESLYLSLI